MPEAKKCQWNMKLIRTVILTESYKSTQIEGTRISQDEMFYLKYLEKTDDNREIQNLKRALGYAGE